MKPSLPSESLAKQQSDVCQAHFHLAEAWRSLDRARQIAMKHESRWPVMKSELEQAMTLLAVNMGTLESSGVEPAKANRSRGELVA